MTPARLEKDWPRRGDAFLAVDMQLDFMPGGALGVSGGDELVPLVNRCLAAFAARGLPVFASRDWHPPGHCSFEAQGGPWPVHCVRGSRGAAFHPDLRLPAGTGLVDKATEVDREAYSTFAGTGLARRLHEAGVTRVFLAGLATDYCVIHSVRDALQAGFEVVVVRDGVRAVDVVPGDGAAALDEMARLGAQFVNSVELCR